MTMPETAVHENDLTARYEHKIRFTRQVSAMQAVTVAQRVDEVPDDQFRLCIRATDARHALRTLCGGQDVGHGEIVAGLVERSQ